MRIRRKSRITKLGFTFIVLLFLLTALSYSYAMWTETNQIHGTASSMEDFNYLCLEGYWPLNETSGTNAPDLSMSQNDGTLYGDATWLFSQGIGGCLYFDGDSDYVQIPDHNNLDITDEITIMVWINPISTNSNWPTVLAKWSGVSYFEVYWLGIQNNKIGAEVTTDDGNFYRETTNDIINLNEWQHIAMTFNSVTNTFTIYRNGNFVEEWTDVTGSIIPSDEDLTIGVVKRTNNHHYFNGLIDEVKIYSCCLSEDDILDDYNKDTPV